MKLSTLQRIQDICTAFDHQVEMKKSALEITGTHPISVTSPSTNLYDLTYHSAPDTSHTIHCNNKHVNSLILEIVSRTEYYAVSKKPYTLDLHTFLVEEGQILVQRLITELTDQPHLAPEIIGNQYVLAYHKGWVFIANDIFFEETYPLLIKIDQLKKEWKRHLKSQQ